MRRDQVQRLCSNHVLSMRGEGAAQFVMTRGRHACRRRQSAFLLSLLGFFSVALLAYADEADDQFAVAVAHIRDHRWSLAQREIEDFLERFPEDRRVPDALFYLGEALVELKQYEPARSAFRDLRNRFSSPPHQSRVLFRIGQMSWRLEDDDAAATELQIFLSQFPDDPLGELALPYLADAELATGRLTEARQHYEKAMRRYPQGRLVHECRYGLARALEQLGEFEPAIRLYQQVAASPGTDLADDAQLNWGARLFEQERYQEALAAFEGLLEKFPQSSLRDSARMNRGWTLYQLGRFEESAEEFGTLIEHPQFGAGALYWQGLSVKALRNWSRAAEILLQAAQEHADSPQAPEMLFHAADALFQQERYPEAADHFLRVVKQWPTAAVADQALYWAAQAGLIQGQYEKVVQLADRLARQFPDSERVAEVQVLAARAHLQQGRPAQALETLAPLLSQATASEPLLVNALYLAGASHHALGNYENATSLLRQYLEQDPDGAVAARARSLLVLSLAHQRQYDQAEAECDRLVQQDPKSEVAAATTYRLAELCYADGRWDRAANRFQWLADNDVSGRDRPRALSGLGWCWFQKREWDRAAKTFGMLIAEYPDDDLSAEAALVRGQALEAAGHTEGALEAYQWLWEHHADSSHVPQAVWQMARLHVKMGNHPQAVEQYRQLFQRYPHLSNKDRALYESAWAYLDLQDESQANRIFLELAQQFPKSRWAAEALLNVTESEYRAGRYEHCERLLLDLRQKLQDSDSTLDPTARERIEQAVLYRLGRIAADREQWNKIREPFEQLIERFPSSPMVPEARFWLAEADYRQGQYKEAKGRFEELARSAAANSSPWLGTVWLRRAQVRAHGQQWQEALAVLDELKKQYPKYELSYEADYLQGQCLARLARFDEARAALRQVLRHPRGQKTETAAQAQWMIGETYFHQKEYSRALREFLRVEILYDYPVWQAAALLEAGKCAEQLHEWQQAAEFYGRLLGEPDYSKTQFAPQAARRLEAVQKQLAASRGR